MSQMRRIYGDDPLVIEERWSDYMRIAQESVLRFGGAAGIRVFRAPARINLKGVHIDHQGGQANYVCVAQEILVAGRARGDDLVTLRNVDKEVYPPRSFRIGDELPRSARSDWSSFVGQSRIEQGDWGNYAKSAILRLQAQQGEHCLCGMDLLLLGSIRGSGLSSSSALVVGTMLAVAALNGIDLPQDEIVRLSGEGEWYVGTRGGMGDHAAIVHGKRGHVAHIGFFPMTWESIPLFKGVSVVIADSLVEARKAAGARDVFNSRVTAYRLGLSLIQGAADPEVRPRLRYLRDVLTLPRPEVYSLLRRLPERLTRNDAYTLLDDHDLLDGLFETHKEPEEGYLVRQVCLFGLAECERSRIAANYLRTDDPVSFGELMYISHDGDRVAVFDDSGRMTPWMDRTTDQQLARLSEDVCSHEQARRDGAALYKQPGGYRCSCERMDFMVDLSRRIPGVLGAGLTGAGLGGNVMLLAREEAVPHVVDVLTRCYYNPRGLPARVKVAVSVDGAGEVTL